jgi:hypothetical protein
MVLRHYTGAAPGPAEAQVARLQAALRANAAQQ